MVSQHDGGGRGMSGAALITLAAIGGGLYYFYGPNGQEHRKSAKNRFDRGAKAAGRALKQMKGWNKEASAAVMSALQTRYPFFRDIDWAALSELGEDARNYWRSLTEEKGNSRTVSRRKSRARQSPQAA